MAFLLADAVTNYAGLALADETGATRAIPAADLAGTVVALPIVLLHLVRTDPATLGSILALFLAVAVLEVGYMEREPSLPAELAPGGNAGETE